MWPSIRQLWATEGPMGAEESSVRARWLGQIPAYILSHGVAFLTGLVSIAILPRILGPEQYGAYALIMATANMAASLFGEWLVPSGIRLSSEVPHGFIWNTLGWMAVFSSILGGVAVGALLSGQQLSPHVGLWASLFAVAMILSKASMAYIRTTLDRRLIAGYTFVSSLGSLLLSLSLFLVGRHLTWLIVGLSIAPWSLFLIYSFKFRWFLTQPRLDLVQSVLRFGLPIAITSIGGQILQVADRYMLALFKTHADVGIYNATYNLSDKFLGLCFSVLFSSMYPVASHAWARGNRADAESLLVNLFRFMTIVAGAFAWFQAASGVSFIRLLAGEAFRPPSLVPVLVALGSWIWFTGILQHQPLEWDKRTLWVTAMTLFTAILNLALNWILIPSLGVIGAAIATLVSYSAYLLVCTFVTKHYGYYARVWEVWVILGTSLGAFLLWYRFQGNAGLLQGTLAALVYVGLGLGSRLLLKIKKGAQ